MNVETPLVAAILIRMAQRGVPVAVSDNPHPIIETSADETIHSAFFLLQETTTFPLRFRFKGGRTPYSSDLAGVLDEYSSAPEHWAEELAPNIELPPEHLAKLDRLGEISALADLGPTPAERIRLLASYLYVTRTPTRRRLSSDEKKNEFLRIFADRYDRETVDAAAAAAEHMPLAD